MKFIKLHSAITEGLILRINVSHIVAYFVSEETENATLVQTDSSSGHLFFVTETPKEIDALIESE